MFFHMKTAAHVAPMPAVHLSDALLLASDGTLWSHAATLGTFKYAGVEFTIGADEVTQMVQNFSAARVKIPVDYDHGTTNGSADGSKPVPKAGDVVELYAVLSDSDITPAIQAQIDKVKDAQAALGASRDYDPRGLWARWRPTPKAQQLVSAREYTEMSVAFDVEGVDKYGADVGTLLKAIALTNLPFLDNMVSIAANDRSSATAGTPANEDNMSDTPNKGTLGFGARLALAASLLVGKPVETEEAATVELAAFKAQHDKDQKELSDLRDFRSVVGAELGKADITPAEAVTKVRELSATAKAATDKATSELANTRKAVIDGITTVHAKKLTVPLKAVIEKQLAANLDAGQKPGETDTEAMLKAMPEVGELAEQHTQADGGASIDTAELSVVNAKIQAAMNDPQVKALTAKGAHNDALLMATSIAMRTASTGTAVS